MVFKKSKSCKCKSSKSKQRGGQASSCLPKQNLGKYLNSACHQANLHNTNPEAGDLSLAQGSGFLPGLSGGAKLDNKDTQTGGSQCSIPSKPTTFDDYKASIKQYLGVTDQFGGTKKSRKTKSKKVKQSKKQTGGTYFSINPEEMIGGLPRIDKGDSCCHGAVLGGKFVQGNGGRAICGNQIGAGKTKKRKQKQLRGGSSIPASYPDAFESAENSNFSPDASDKDFGCRQPFWGAKCR